jgi:hypothetical protein
LKAGKNSQHGAVEATQNSQNRLTL